MTPDDFYDWIEARDALHPMLRQCSLNDIGIEYRVSEALRENESPLPRLFFFGMTEEGAPYWREIDSELHHHLIKEKHMEQTRKVDNSAFKLFGSAWKHPALKPYNGQNVTVKPNLNDSHQTYVTVTKDGTEICTITPEDRL